MKKLQGHEIEDRAVASIESITHNKEDPSAWQTLYYDSSIPMRRKPKACYLKGISSPSRQFLLPMLRPFCRLAIYIFQVFKVLVPNAFHSSKILHKSIYWGLKYFVSPEANYIILRHFNIGSQILQFIVDNIDGLELKPGLLFPKKLEDVYKDEIFLKHDINLYNFLIELNLEFKNKNLKITPPKKLNFSAIQSSDFGIGDLPDGFFNFIDAETAIEIYTPLYQLFLKDIDFWRAHHSLQFDETIAIYVAHILGNPTHLALVNNKHPLAPLTGTQAGYRLLLHGLSSENLHGLLQDFQRLDEENQSWRPMLRDRL